MSKFTYLTPTATNQKNLLYTFFGTNSMKIRGKNSRDIEREREGGVGESVVATVSAVSCLFCPLSWVRRKTSAWRNVMDLKMGLDAYFYSSCPSVLVFRSVLCAPQNLKGKEEKKVRGGGDRWCVLVSCPFCWTLNSTFSVLDRFRY